MLFIVNQVSFRRARTRRAAANDDDDDDDGTYAQGRETRTWIAKGRPAENCANQAENLFLRFPTLHVAAPASLSLPAAGFVGPLECAQSSAELSGLPDKIE